MNKFIADFLEIKLDDGTAGSVMGYGSTFNNVDQGKDRCIAGCFNESLKTCNPAMLWQHDQMEPIGEWTEVREDAKGLKVKGQLWLGKGIQKAEQAYLMMKCNGPKGLSIGYRTRKASYDEKTGVRSLECVDLKEISVVSFPMNEKAKIVSVKSQIADGIVPTIRDLEEILRDVGLSAKHAKILLAEGYSAFQREAGEPDASKAELIDSIGKLIKTIQL